MMRRLAPVFLLAVLSPVVAEFLLGDQYLMGPPSFAQIGELALFVLLYGCGAILIREAARRAGRGWPTIVVLALAYGVVEEGLITQSLFNPGYLDAHLLDYGYLPALGIAPPWTVFVLALHTVWSISAPIAVVEGGSGNHERPWLGRVGTSVATGLFLLGAAATFAISWVGGHYVAPLPLLLAAVVVAAVLVVVAFRLPRPAAPRPAHWAGFVFGLLAASAFLLFSESTDALPPVLTTVVSLVILAVAAVVIARWRWADPFGLGAGAVVAYCWHGMPTAIEAGPAAVVEQVVLVVVVLALLVVLARRAVARSRVLETG